MYTVGKEACLVGTPWYICPPCMPGRYTLVCIPPCMPGRYTLVCLPVYCARCTHCTTRLSTLARCTLSRPINEERHHEAQRGRSSP